MTVQKNISYNFQKRTENISHRDSRDRSFYGKRDGKIKHIKLLSLIEMLWHEMIQSNEKSVRSEYSFINK